MGLQAQNYDLVIIKVIVGREVTMILDYNPKIYVVMFSYTYHEHSVLMTHKDWKAIIIDLLNTYVFAFKTPGYFRNRSTSYLTLYKAMIPIV